MLTQRMLLSVKQCSMRVSCMTSLSARCRLLPFLPQLVTVFCEWQSDKRVICDPAQTLSDGDSTDRKCIVKKEVEAVGRCVFNIDLWNLGGTCIANHLHKHELEVNSTMKPQCPDTAYETIIDTIADLCQLPVNGDSALCTPLAMAF